MMMTMWRAALFMLCLPTNGVTSFETTIRSSQHFYYNQRCTTTTTTTFAKRTNHHRLRLAQGSNDEFGFTTVNNAAVKQDDNLSYENNQPTFDWEAVGKQLLEEVNEIKACAKVVLEPFFQQFVKAPSPAAAADVTSTLVQLCDELDQFQPNPDLWTSRELQLRRRALEFQRYERLCQLLNTNYDAYVATASFFSNRIPRDQLPNVQDIPLLSTPIGVTTTPTPAASSPNVLVDDSSGIPLVADCELENMVYQDSWLDQLLLSIFRNLVEKNTGGVTSDKPGIQGLLDQGRQFMLQPGQTAEAQHRMVYDTLAGLMTPALPPFYRIFMSGIVPRLGTEWDGKQLGPWFYAPWLTSIVTPTFFAFLVGPSKPNRRKDGQLGGLVVEKCKFLQESGCKGLCLHQCKLPAQQFFQEALGLPLTVSPNFVTQECQWSFGEVPLPPSQDPSFPKGCLVGCGSRRIMVDKSADVCN